jgi:3-dehydroquinate synthase
MIYELSIEGETGSSLVVSGERIQNLGNYLPRKRVIVITDDKVGKLYQSILASYEVITVQEGEKSKSLDTVGLILQKLVEMKADRDSFILAFGGGVVCDLTGFVASIYMRGIRFGYVATTLMAQADASIGGKNGINVGGIKNLAGIFRQPEFVLCDPVFLKTLDKDEISSGFAEMIKHALIADEQLLNHLETNIALLNELDQDLLPSILHRSLLIKTSIVSRDEKEKGERRKLNFGHTFGHAIETIYGFKHGHAVSIGMVMAALLSVKKGYILKKDLYRIITLLKCFGLPVEISPQWPDIFRAIELDKKRESGYFHFVLLKKPGEAVIESLDYDFVKSITDIYEREIRRYS